MSRLASQRARRSIGEHAGYLRDERERVIIVAPPDVSRRIARTAAADDAILFDSLDALDQWRRHSAAADSIAEDVAAALSEVESGGAAIPRKLRDVLESISAEDCVPPLSAIEARWPSRRSFYRVWTQALGEPPSAFLRRVQAHHARRLIKIGLTKKEAALRAGFSSVDQMRRHINK